MSTLTKMIFTETINKRKQYLPPPAWELIILHRLHESSNALLHEVERSYVFPMYNLETL